MSLKSPFLIAAVMSTTLLMSPNPSAARAEDERHLDMDLLDASREQCSIASAAVTELSDILRAARHAKDMVQVQTTLDQTQSPLLALKTHLGSCGDIMRMLSTAPQHVKPTSAVASYFTEDTTIE